MENIKSLSEAEEITLRQHWDGYPHSPGTLYDCPDCENNCYCDDMGTCLHCELENEAFDAQFGRSETVRLREEEC